MECANKIRFLTGTYVKIVALTHYVADARQRLSIKQKTINIAKEHTCDEGKWSKVLATCATKDYAD